MLNILPDTLFKRNDHRLLRSQHLKKGSIKLVQVVSRRRGRCARSAGSPGARPRWAAAAAGGQRLWAPPPRPMPQTPLASWPTSWQIR